MSFANPTFLWAFAGLSIPVAIHLLSRKEGKVIRVGSIRHVDESNTSQFKSIRLNEILLLLLRCLMIASVVLFLSGAQCSGPADGKKIVYAEAGIDTDSLTSKGYELHEIPPGSYWSFAEHLNKMPYEIIVLSHSYLKDFRGKRIALNGNIQWITTQPVSTQYQALAWSDSIRVANSTSLITTYKTISGIPDSIKLTVISPAKVSTDDKMVIAALNVLKENYKLPLEFSGDQKIIVTPSIGPFVERVSPTEIHINKKLDQDVALNENLVIGLFKVLYPELQKDEVKKEVRVMPDELAFSRGRSAPVVADQNMGIEKYLVLLFGLALAAERFVAIRRNQ